MKDHASIRERLLDLAYGELSRREARAVERHLASCPACRGELESIRETRAVMSALAPEPAPEAGERVLLAAARRAAERARERRRGRLLPPWAWAGSIGAVAVAAVALVTVGLPLLHRERVDDRDALLGAPAGTASPAAPPAEPAPPASQPPADGAVARAGSRREAAGPGRAEARQAAPKASRTEPLRDAAGGSFAAAPPAAPERASAPEAASAPPAAPPPAVAEAVEGFAVRKRAAAASPAPRAEAVAASDAEASAPAGPAAPARIAPDPVGSWERLRAAGRLERSVRRFDGCPEEQVREIDRDPSGGVVRLATLRASAGWVEQFYAPDGTLAAVRFGPAEARRTVRLERGVPVPGLPPGLVQRAADVSGEAAPRCR